MSRESLFSVPTASKLEASEKVTNKEFRKRQQDSLADLNDEIGVFFRSYEIDFTKKAKDKRDMKKQFFYFSLGLLALLVLTPCVFISYSVFSRGTELSEPIMIGGFVQVLSSIVAIPLIIAGYLFNKEEDAYQKDIVQAILNYSQSRNKDEMRDSAS